MIMLVKLLLLIVMMMEYNVYSEFKMNQGVW